MLANQERVTAENIAKAEQQVQRLTKGGAKPELASTSPPNGKVEKPSEPTPTSNGDEPSVTVANEVAEDKLEAVKNNEDGAKVEVEAADA
jgi:hypothetical protein